MDVDSLCSWLERRLPADLVAEAWIFGSAVRDAGSPQDVDVFIKYPDGASTSIPQLRRRLEEEFAVEFGTPLHLLLLTCSESREADEFLDLALERGVRVR